MTTTTKKLFTALGTIRAVDGVKRFVPKSPIFIQSYIEKLPDGKEVACTFSTKLPTRTNQQNKALHKFFSLLAEEMNEAGYTVQMVLKEKVDLDWTGDMVKELLWRPAQQAILGKKSTTELRKQEDIDDVFEHLNRHMGGKFGIFVDFPHSDDKTTDEYGRVYISNVGTH